MSDKTRRGFLAGTAAVFGAAGVKTFLDLSGERNVEGSKPEAKPGELSILDPHEVDREGFEDWVDESEQLHQRYENHEDVFEEVSDELEEETPYSTDIRDYNIENAEDGRGVMVTDDVVLATTEDSELERELDGDTKWFMSPGGVDAAIEGFPTVEEFLEDCDVPEVVNVDRLKGDMNRFGRVAPFVPKTKYDQANFDEEIIEEFADQRDELDEYIDQYQTILTGGEIELESETLDIEGLGPVLDNIVDLQNDIKGTSVEDIDEEKYQEEYVKLKQATELLKGGDDYKGVSNTLNEAEDLYVEVAGELGALVVLSEVYDVSIQEMKEGSEVYDEGDYDREGQPKDEHHDGDHKHHHDDHNKDQEYDDHKDDKHDESDDVETDPVYTDECAKIKNWDMYDMWNHLSEDQQDELMEDVIDDIYDGEVSDPDVLYDDSIEGPGETAIVFLHYRESEVGQIEDTEIGFRMANEEGRTVPTDGGSRFGPAVYGTYDVDEDLAQEILDYGNEIECRSY